MVIIKKLSMAFVRCQIWYAGLRISPVELITSVSLVVQNAILCSNVTIKAFMQFNVQHTPWFVL
jgi:hypothetical protein